MAFLGSKFERAVVCTSIWTTMDSSTVLNWFILLHLSTHFLEIVLVFWEKCSAFPKGRWSRCSWPSETFSHLHAEPLEISKSDHWIFCHIYFRDTFPRIAQFEQTVWSGRVLVAVTFFYFSMTEATGLLRVLPAAEFFFCCFFFLPSTDLCVDTILSLKCWLMSKNLLLYFLSF